MVKSAENGFDVFTTGEESVSLEENVEVTDSNLGLASSDIVKRAHFNEVGRHSELLLRVVSVSLKGQLLF